MDSVTRFGGLSNLPDEQVRYFTENRVYALQIESTSSCLQECIYCYAGARPQTNGILTSTKIIEIIDDAKALGVKEIDWLGGDPLRRNDWKHLMEHARNQGLVNNLWTSGTLLADRETCRKVVELTEDGFVSVHLDSINSKTFGLLHRGDAEKFIKKILNGVENLFGLGKSEDNILNCITYTKLQKPEDVKKTIAWFWKNKGIRSCVVSFKPAGFGNKMPELKPSLEDIKNVFEYRDALNYQGSPYKLGSQDVNKFYCGTMFCITFDGNVTPCSVIREGITSVHQKRLREIISEHLDDLIFTRMHRPENLPAGCSDCDNNQVCWGCRANAWYYASDLEAADPTCWLNVNLK